MSLIHRIGRRCCRALYRVKQFVAVKLTSERSVDQDWAAEYLSAAELAAFSRLKPADRLHSLRIAKRIAADLDGNGQGKKGSRVMIRTALLHDIGKAGGISPVVRSIFVLLHGRAGEPSFRKLARNLMPGVYASYMRIEEHPRLGAEMLEGLGVEAEVVRMVREHHSRTEDPFLLQLQNLDQQY